MGWDNRAFNVNGRGKESLRDVLRIAFAQWGEKTTAVSYTIDPKNGLTFQWHNEKGLAFPSPLGSDDAAAVAWTWLESSPKTECVGNDANADHDGDNSLGWRVYYGGGSYCIATVKPAFLWHGK